MFDYYAVFTFEGMNDEEAFEAVAEYDVVDVFTEDGYTTVYANSSDYQGVRDALLAAKPDLTFVEDVVTYVPQNTVTLTDQKEIDQFNRLRTMLDDIDDVQDLFHNIVGLDDEE
jgi:transcriptional/translational regulatory protein YebC/TACO1